MSKKILAVLAALVFAIGLATPALATEVTEPPAVEYPSEVELRVSEDSVGKDHDILYDLEYDAVAQVVYLVIKPDLRPGYKVYDVSDTDYIDGIRANGDYVYSYKVPMVGTEPIVIGVKVVYTEDLFGDLASMYDGNYDYSKLFSNPVLFLQGLYYVLAIGSVLVSAILLCRGKGSKIKTSNEIADSVSTAVQDATSKMHEDIVGTVMTEAQEVLDSIFTEMKGLVTAVTVSMFKTKDAPITALDILENMKTLSSTEVIERVRTSVQKKLDGQDTAAEAKKNALRSIAAGDTPNSVIDDKEPASDEASESIF